PNSIDLPGAAETGFAFGEFRLEPDGTLFRGHLVIHLTPKELDALRILLARAGQIVTPAELRQQLWGSVHVTADSVPRCVSSLRLRLMPEDCIQTVYKRGYRFAAEVQPYRSRRAESVPRIAILPFESLHGFPPHLGQAVVEETIDRLVNMRPAPASILARDSVFTLARAGHTAQQIGRALEADLVLAGALRALPTHFRLRAQMIRVDGGTEIWVEDFLVERGKSSAMAPELVERLAIRLGGVTPSIAAQAAPDEGADRVPQRREAWEIYLHGKFESQSFERHRLQDGLQHLLRATEMDPSFAAAQVSLANLCCAQAFLGFMSPEVAAETVRRAAGSIPADSREADAVLPALGWVSFHVDRDLAAAIRAFSRCAWLPHDPFAWRMQAMFALGRHRFDEASERVDAALRADPFSPLLHAVRAWTLHLSGRMQESVEQVRRCLDEFANYDGVVPYAAIILTHSGNTEHGARLAEKLASSHPYSDLAAAVHAYALASAGRADEARAILERLRWLGRERFVLRSFTPAAYIALGEAEAAIEELRAADESRCPWFFQMLADPRLQSLQAHPEFGRMRGVLAGMEAAAADADT
ncbi:MAG TPA: winged helix-turn-helix domain-containing protein, partial [Terracidiphilus sp.]|nr:winged helix-turn-helix domain-containing protein [Terracidiphilus sp.]